MSFINIAILTLLLVLSLAVLVKAGKRISDYFLLSIILAIALFVMSAYWANLSLTHKSFALLNIASYLPFAPILFYGLLLTSSDQRLNRSWWWLLSFHFVFFLFVLGDVYLWNNYNTTEIRAIFEVPPMRYQLFYQGLHIYMISVLIWFLGKLRAYQSKIKDYYSNLERVDLSWFKYFLWVAIISYSSSFTALISLNLGIINDIETVFLFITVALFLALIWMIYHAVRQYSPANFSETTPNTEKQSKYATSSLTKERSQEVFKKVEELFENEKIYHNPELKVQDVAKQLGVTNHNISQAINETADKSFYDFVNDYRLEYFQRQLADPDKRRYTILALGLESGFNSKASLNRVFKKQIGETPKEYQQRMLA